MIPRGQYGAVLVDEGHDFEPHWLRLIVQMVDPTSNALLLLYDDAQAIYAKSSRPKFSFASVGIEARGRTTILKLNYRNTWEILTVAKTFAGHAPDIDGMDEDAPTLITPESVGRHGPVPKLIRCASLNAEADSIGTLIESAVEERCSLDQLAVVWRHWRHAEMVANALTKRRIAFTWAKDAQTKERLFEGGPSVKLVSMHSSKGLEFERVFIPAIGTLPEQHDDAADEAKLLYVAMTRSTEQLIMTHSSDSIFTDRISGALENLPAQGLAA
jgi:superfamily I DNA/RNA helicase